MITATRRWLRRNRTSLGIGVGVIGVGYVAGQYVLSKISEARERMTGDRIAKENLRRRFQQNQDDCTITVLELLPTVTENILEALPSEQITDEIKKKRSGRSAATSEIAPSEVSSSGNADEDGRSLSSFQSENFVHASQMGASNLGDSSLQSSAKSKAQLWNDLKISSITRSFTLLYTASLLSLLTRIQLNLLGRRNYFSSVVSSASYNPSDPTINLENREDDDPPLSYGNDFETNRKYLTYSWWLLHKGWQDVRTSVENAVKEVFGPLKPTEDVTLERLSTLVLEVRRKIEGATPEERRTRKYLPYLLPPRDQEDTVLTNSGIPPTPSPSSPAPLRRLLDETADLIDSPHFTAVLTHTLDATFSHLVDTKLRIEAYHIPPLPPPIHRIEDVTETETEMPEPGLVKAKLATILAVVTREAHKIGSGGGLPNEYVQALEGVGEVEAFAAVIFAGEEGGRGVGDEGITHPSEESGISGGSMGGETGTGKSVEEMREEEAEAAVRVLGVGAADYGIGGAASRAVGAAGGVVDAARGGWESVWGRVSGLRGGEAGLS